METLVISLFSLAGLVGILVIPAMTALTVTPDWPPSVVIGLVICCVAVLLLPALLLKSPASEGPVARFQRRTNSILIPIGACLLFTFPLWSGSVLVNERMTQGDVVLYRSYTLEMHPIYFLMLPVMGILLWKILVWMLKQKQHKSHRKL